MPLVEQLSIDEAFLDVSALDEPGDLSAAQLRAAIREELGWSCSLGIATNKLVVKLATCEGKSLVRSGAMPQAICVVPSGDKAAFLALLSIHTIGDTTAWPAADLARHFGQHGEDLAHRA